MSAPRLHFADRESWRAWLEEHHGEIREVWLIFYKKGTGRRSIAYDAAVEEALCFGWIDSLIKKLDERRYLRKFTPRTDAGKWSALNLERVRRMIDAGRMTAAGLAMLELGVKPVVSPLRGELEMPDFFAVALEGNAKARAGFAGLAPSYRKHYLAWLGAAKRPETRARRLQEALAKLVKGEQLGLK